MRKLTLFRIIGAFLGIALLSYLVLRVGPSTLVQSLHRLGWGLAAIIALGGVAHFVKALAWRLTLAESGSGVSLGCLLQLRLVSEAAGQVGALGQMFGDSIRVSAMNVGIPFETRVSSVTLDRALFMVTGAFVSVTGFTTAAIVVPFAAGLRLYAVAFAIAVIGMLGLGALAISKRWRFLSASARILCRMPHWSARIERRLPVIRSVEDRLFDFHRRTRFAFWGSMSLNLVCHGLAILEVYLILVLLGIHAGVAGALVFESVTKLVNLAGTLNPGNVGTYEGGTVLIARMFALPTFTGLAVAVARRARAIFWTAIGIVCLVLISRKAAGAAEEVAEAPKGTPTLDETAQSTAALILIEDAGSPLARVGTLPVLLRTILGLKKAGATKIIVCTDFRIRRKAERDVLDSGRCPHFVEWIEPQSRISLPRLFGEVIESSRAQKLLVVDGESSYHPNLFRKACDWKEEDGALLLTSAAKPIGILALSKRFARKAGDCNDYSLGELQAWLSSCPLVEREEIPNESWQRIVTKEDHVAAERKLDRWLVKPTDGIFARFNRRISVPISRQLIKFPITPNMVSLFTLGVGFAAAILFARGGYWNMLAGAILSLFASILDGCDGEVARLKLMDSEFGCWLETICDYLYYLFVFCGISFGLAKTLGSSAAMRWGCMLLLGAVMSFVVTSLGRRRYAGRRPEQYLAIWQSNAEKRRSNPILYVGRNLEFIARRCFMPYALLAFALLNLLNVVFFLATIGANMVWLISLYSYGAFAVRSTSKGRSFSAERAAVAPAD